MSTYWKNSVINNYEFSY